MSFEEFGAVSAERLCVICDQNMEPKMVEEVEVDYCPDCHGLWLDKDEILQLVEKSDDALGDLRDLLETPVPPLSVPLVERACPACRGKLSVALFEGVAIRHCAECDGIFLERGELDKAITAIKLRDDEAGTIVALARSVVARGVIGG